MLYGVHHCMNVSLRSLAGLGVAHICAASAECGARAFAALRHRDSVLAQRLLPRAKTLPFAPSQETLNNLRKAMENTKIMCAVMLDTKVRGAWLGRRQGRAGLSTGASA